MDKDLPNGARHSKIPRSSNGCWTCKVRRKKCDEHHPVCDACATLYITCHYDQDKPEWMDGGARQEETAERLKHEVKEQARRRRRGEHVAPNSGDNVSITEATSSEAAMLSQTQPVEDLATPEIHNGGLVSRAEAPNILSQRGTGCTLLNSKDADRSRAIGRSDTILLMFYLERVLPFLFPFYHPSIVEGGRAWVLEMMISSPVVRQATLCQSSYFFSLVCGAARRGAMCETVLTQMRAAFEALRQAMQVINSSGVAQHLDGAVRIMASIMQVQRFEIAVLSFDNCQAHLNAALVLFKQLLDGPGAIDPAEPNSRFSTVMDRLGQSPWILSDRSIQVSSAEQAAFRFSSSLLILDDIIASTVLQESPRLHEYHCSLLGGDGDKYALLDLEAVVGCQNWALLLIGEIAVLDAWKQQCKRAGNLDVMDLVHRATTLKTSLEAHSMRLEANQVNTPKDDNNLLDIFEADYGQQSKTLVGQSSLVTRIWAHAALIYLSVVVSGWQPSSVDVRYYVSRIIELLKCQISPPKLIRTMVWPFCVAGCLAQPEQEACLRGMVEALQPPSAYGTVWKALEIMENVWRNRDVEDATSRDLATCLKSQGDLVLLV
ncbi:hypothetical protein MMC10_005777 [Thelotrema lepadinum]|nr:hypothetical protein [Thelotrema lepadinum]